MPIDSNWLGVRVVTTVDCHRLNNVIGIIGIYRVSLITLPNLKTQKSRRKTAAARIRAVWVAPKKRTTHDMITMIQIPRSKGQGKFWNHKICLVIQRRLNNINTAWQTFLLCELGTGSRSNVKTSELSGRKKMAAKEEQSAATSSTKEFEDFNQAPITARG